MISAGAGLVWFDRERHEWRLSTLPVGGFATEQEAIDLFNLCCNSETGLRTRFPRQEAEATKKLHRETMRGQASRAPAPAAR